MNSIYVHTLGDSTLDNVYWMLNKDGTNIEEAKSQSVEGQLQFLLQEEIHQSSKVISHAYDGFTTKSLIQGDYVGRVLPGINIGRANPKGVSYLVGCKNLLNSENRYISPLNQIKSTISSLPEATHYIVLSVCGNDFREQLANPIQMLRNIPSVHARYNTILDELNTLKHKNVKPILMFQYRVDANNDGYYIYTILKVIGAVSLALTGISAAFLLTSLTILTGTISAFTGVIFILLGATGLIISNKILPLRVIQKVLTGQEVSMAALGALMERFYQPILKRAKEEAIPILDLPNTFNPYKPLYLASIEPSIEGGKLIAEGINHVVKNHDFSSDSKLYAKNDSQTEYTASENPGYAGWRVKAPQK